MRILAVTNIFPTRRAPFSGIFVEQQIKGLKQIAVDVDVMFVDRAENGMRAYLGVRQRVRTMTAKYQPDVVHVMYGGIMADIVTRTIQDRPTVVSFCGSDLLGENLSGIVRKYVASYGIRASHNAATRAAGIVVKSKNLHAALPGSIDREKVRIIPNGVDLEVFKPLDRETCRNRLGWNADFFHVLFATNSGDPCKRFDLAQAAVAVLSDRGITAQIHQLRGISHGEVPLWINASDVLMLTSAHEGSPNIVKEALACDLPVVSVDVGDVRERIEGIDGCYIAAPDSIDLAAKLGSVYCGRRRVSGRVNVQELSLERIALNLKNFYDNLVCLGTSPRLQKIS